MPVKKFENPCLMVCWIPHIYA